MIPQKYDLKSFLSNSEDRDWQRQILVLGIPRGGVKAESAGTRKLSTNLEIITPKRLFASYDEALVLFQEYVSSEKAKAMELIESRLSKYQKISPRGQGLISNKTIVLIDGGASS